jgi:hypothetical protein
MIKAFVVAGVSVLAAIEFASPPRTADAVSQPAITQPVISAIGHDASETLTPERLTSETSTPETLTHETLTPTDRTIPYAAGHRVPVGGSVPEQFASTEPSTSLETTAAVVPVHPKKASRKTEPTTRRVTNASLEPKPKPGHDDRKRAEIAADRSKPVKTHEKNCQSTIVGDFLRTLNISSGCNS